MFVERIEILEYRQNFKEEPSTFPDSTYHWNVKKSGF